MSELNDAPIRRIATNILNNDYVFAVVAIMAFAYAQRAAPPLPDWLIETFSINWVRVLFLSLLLVFRFETRPTVAIIIALTFVFILQRIHIQEAKEEFEIIQNAKHQIRKNMKRRKKKTKHMLQHRVNDFVREQEDINVEDVEDIQHNVKAELAHYLTGSRKIPIHIQ